MPSSSSSLAWRLVRVHGLALWVGAGLICWYAPLPIPEGSTPAAVDDLGWWWYVMVPPGVVGLLAGIGEGVLLRSQSGWTAWLVLAVAGLPGIWVPLVLVAPAESDVNWLDLPALLGALLGWLAYTVCAAGSAWALARHRQPDLSTRPA